MKKLALILLITLSYVSINAQNNYVNFGTGWSPGDESITAFQFEYGYKLSNIDLSLSLVNKTSLPFGKDEGMIKNYMITDSSDKYGDNLLGKQVSALLFNVKFDLLQFLQNNNKHRLLVGLGVGIGENTNIYQELNSTTVNQINTLHFRGLIYSYILQYEYCLNDKFNVGIKFDHIQPIEISPISLTINRKF